MTLHGTIQRTGGLVLVAVLVLSFLLVAPARAITWGWPDEGRHPNVGAMVAEWSDGTLGQVCSGTLIAPSVFLTAGHCTAWLPDAVAAGEITALYVNFDEYALTEATLLPVANYVTHPSYSWLGRSNVYDVGLLVLAEPVVGITPANLPEEGLLDTLKKTGKLREGKNEADFTVVGYGTQLDWPPPEMFNEDSRRYAESEFQSLLKSWLIMSQNYATADGGTAYGDSGGPTFWVEPDGTETIVSVTSWGDVPCVAVGITYRIDTPDALDFIDMVVLAAGWLAEE